MAANGDGEVQFVRFVLQDIISALDRMIEDGVQRKENGQEPVQDSAMVAQTAERLLLLLNEPVAARALFGAMRKYSEAPIGAALRGVCSRLVTEMLPELTLGEPSNTRDIDIVVDTFFAQFANHCESKSAKTQKNALYERFVAKYHVRPDQRPYCSHSEDSIHQRAVAKLMAHFGIAADLPTGVSPATALSIDSEKSYFYHLEKSLLAEDFYTVDKLRLLAAHSSYAGQLPFQYRIVSRGSLRQPIALMEETNEPLEAMQRLIFTVVQRCEVQHWQITELERLEAASGNAALSAEILADPLFLLVVLTRSLADFSEKCTETHVQRFLSNIFQRIGAQFSANEANSRSFFCYGLFYWFTAMNGTNTSIFHTDILQIVAAVHPIDTLTQKLLLVEPFVVCCRESPALFSYLNSAIEWPGADWDAVVVEDVVPQPPPPAAVREALKLAVLHITMLAAIPSIQQAVLGFLARAVHWYTQCLQKFPLLSAASAMAVAFTALVGATRCAVAPLSASAAVAGVQLLDAVFELAKTHGREDFAFIALPTGRLSAWVHRTAVTLGLTGDSEHYERQYAEWFAALYDSVEQKSSSV